MLAAETGAFGFAPFFAAKAPEVETARIARPTRIVFFMLKLPGWKKTRPAVKHNPVIARVFHPPAQAAVHNISDLAQKSGLARPSIHRA